MTRVSVLACLVLTVTGRGQGVDQQIQKDLENVLELAAAPKEATEEQRKNFEIIGDGQGVHWPDIDEDISAEGMLHGIPARRPRQQA